MDHLISLKLAMADLWWAPPNLRVIDRPEICYTIDKDNRFNMVMRISDDVSAVDSLVAEVSEAHVGFESKVVTYPEQSAALFKSLERHGYAPGHVHDIRHLSLQNLTRPNHPDIQTRIVTTTEELALLEKTQAKAFGVPYKPSSEDELAFTVQEYQKEAPRAIRVLAFDKKSGQPVGAGSMSLFPDLGVCFFFAGGTIPEARHRGVYSALITARLRYAKQSGIEVAGIFARQTSSSPIADRQGFHKCGEMVYWTRTPEAEHGYSVV